VVEGLVGTEATTERYVALGDSYTIGEGVAPDERWPDLVVADLRREGVAIELVANPAVTGWTTAQLIEHELPLFEAARPTFATLLIGVNDWVQGVDADAFRTRLLAIVAQVQATLPDPLRCVAVTIPDFSVTPTGGQYARGRDITAGLAHFNDIVADVAAGAGWSVVDIFPLSRRQVGPEWVAADGLHPSAAAYRQWADLIVPVAREVLAR
jgi:acyl-CoA thioesterase I